MAVQDEPARSLAEAAVAVDTLAELAKLVRQLRRRHARLGDGRELTYREIAAKTGWSTAMVGAYLTGTALPPTDRFDVLIRLFDAGPREQGAMATARDRVAEGRHQDAPGRSTPQGPIVPRQLPSPAAGFTGRAGQLAGLDTLLADRAAAGTMAIAAVLGPAGVGKTALAVHWAHRVADRFPDGQLYANLRGFDPSGTPASTAEVVRGFLDALGVAPQRIPATLEAQLGLYRSLTADRCVLVVLDNARDAGQVRVLLPAGRRCAVAVTSRDDLTGLVAAQGAHPVVLDVLSPAEARDLLAGRLGAARVESEPEAAAEIVARCASLPLALTLVAARAAAHPGFSLAALAAELKGGGEGLAAFDTADPATDVRHVFSWSYRECGADAARLFRYLGLHPGPDIAVAAAASLAGVPASTAKRLLSDLARAHLVAEHAPGRFTCHDLLRAYAAELAQTVDTEADRRAAMHRTLDHYLRTVYSGSMLLNPHRDPITPVAAHDGVTPEDLPDRKQALAWFGAEHAVLLRAVELAAANGFEVHTWQLAWGLTNFLQRLGHWDDQIATQNAALASARRFGDHLGQANAHRHLGRAHVFLGRHDDAQSHLGMALELFGRLGDGVNQAHIHLDLGMTCDRRADHDAALDHARRACELFGAAGHLSGQANALNAVGWEYAQMGDYEQAMTHCQEALALQQEVGDRHAQAGTWDSIAYAHRQLGNDGPAVECYRQALTLYREEGDRFYQAEILSHLGDAHDAAGEHHLARDAWAQALAIMEELGHQDTERVRAKLS